MPGTNFESDNEDFDAQDQAEAFDEDNLQGDDDDLRRTFEELPDVEDMTRVLGDRDDDEALAMDAADFDPDAIDDDDLEDDDELAYRAGDDIDGRDEEDGFALSDSEIEGLEEVRDAGEAEGGEDDFTNFQSTRVSDDDLRAMGYADDRGRPPRGRR